MNFYTTKQAAEILGVSTKRISTFILEGRLHAEKVNGAWKIDALDLLEFSKKPRFKPWGKRLARGTF